MNQPGLFDKTPEELASEPKCISCIFWERVLTNHWGRCEARKSWEMEHFSCENHVEAAL